MEFLETNIIWILLLIIVVFIFTYKKLTKNPDAITSKYEAKKTIKGNLSDHLKNVEEALINAGFRKVVFVRSESRFHAQSGFSMSSFSEFIEVAFSNEQLETELKFKSICALPTQVYDWGKNKRNYKKFEKELEILLPKE